MQKSKLKKGFTLVELAIVIAVIAILIAVLVPTFIALIDKAGESNDSQLVKNLNTSITIDNATGDVVTMKDAIDSAKANGYIVSQITPTSDGYDILWDQETKYFLLADSTGNIVYSTTVYSSDNVSSYTTSRFWKIIDSEENLSSTYSNYIAYDATSVMASTGIDVGENTNVAVTVVSSGSQTQSVKTKVGTATAEKTSNGGTESTIMINSNAGTLVIDTTETVTINGNISANVEIKASTTVVIAAKANVPNFLISAANVTITNNSSVTINPAVTGVGSVTVNGSSNETVTISDTSVLENFAGGYGTENSPYQISTGEQLANIGDLSDSMYNSENGSTAYYFRLINDIDASDISASWISKNFCGTFDGNNYTISNLTLSSTSGNYCAMFALTYGDTIIKDLTLNSISVSAYYSSGNVKAGGIVSNVSSDTTLSVSNVTVSGSVSGKSESSSHTAYAGGLVGCVNGAATVTFVDCVNNAAISSEETDTNRAAYAGGIVGYLKGITAQFENCINTGTIYSTSNGSMGGIVGKVCDGSGAGSLTISGCSNSGVLSGSSASGGIVGNVDFATYACEVEITDSDNTGSIMGSSYAGGILAQANVSTVMISVKITDCNNTGAVTSDTQAGGIAASCSKATFTIENCSNSATITGGTDAVGGLIGVCGSSNGSIANCSNSGNVICASTSGGRYYGGIVGRLSGGTISITGCSNTGKVGCGSSGENYAQYVGGIVGQIIGLSSNAATVTLSNCTVSDCTIYSVNSSYLGYYYGYFSNNYNNSSCTVDESCSYSDVNLVTSSSSSDS